MWPDTADVEAPEPQVLERPYLPTQDVRFSDSSDDSSTNDSSLHARTLRNTLTHMNSGEQRLPAGAIPTDRQSPLRPLSRSDSSPAISGAFSHNSLNDSPRNISNAFEFEQEPLLAPQSTEAMPTVDQGTLRPRLPPRDYHEKVIQNKIPPKMRCIPITEPAVSSNQLTQSQKRDVSFDSCQRTRNLQSISDVHKNPYVHNTYTTFRLSTQSTPPGYSERQKEVKKRYSLKSLRKRLSNKNDVNAVIESSVHPKFWFSQSNILTAATCIAHCVSSDFAMSKGLASTIACCYPELQELRKLPINNFAPGSLVTYFYQKHQRFIYNLVTKRRFFQKPTYETLTLSLHSLKRHLKRHNIHELALPKL